MTQFVESFIYDKEINRIAERSVDNLYHHHLTEINDDGERLHKFKSIDLQMDITKEIVKIAIMLDRYNRENK
tara:strand:- start:534 stop:749 length:216 start_codon:yes stop_codon:yes gene_type:complete